MRLRRKILTVTVIVMGLVFVILSVWLFAERWSSYLDAGRYRRSLEVALGSMGRTLEIGRHPERLAELREAIESGGALEEWVVVDEAGLVVAWGRRAPGAKVMSARAISRRRYDLTVPIEVSPGKRWWLYARSSRLGGSILGGLGDILLVVALGTLFLVTVLYGLLDRLILSPLGDVVHAAQQIERGGQPAKLRGEERFDEMGTLLKSFNRMAREVHDSRKNLEHRVEEAVSGYRRAQSQLAVAQRLSATGKLAAGIAHEINNPLGGMVNAARSVRESLDDGTREAEYAELILDGLDRIARTVQGMLQFSRERLPGEVSRVAVGEVVSAAKGFCTHRIDGEGVDLAVDIPDDLPEITGGPGELQQVVLNLLVNAIDAVGDSDTKRINISARADGDSVELSVADTGCGMDDDTREQAFDIFFTTKDPEAGTGLGLSVAHQIVDDHGGRMEVDSTPGEGTTVKVRLPAAQGAGPERVEGGAGETA